MANAKNLVVVESPAKAKTIGKYLGPDYVVRASMGHVRDLPKSTKGGLGVEVNGGVSLTYAVIARAKKFLSELKRDASGAPAVFLATDPDREGEAIAWHIAEAAKIPPARARRVSFTEITASAVREAFAHPREIDERLVNAQQARRAVDRIVGYRLSPVLWRKVRTGLSAGRVQSAALRLVVDREREIQAFVPREHWTVEAGLETERGEGVAARYPFLEREKFALPDADSAAAVVSAVEGAEWRVAQVKRAEKRRNPAAPFITSTLQQEAARKLGFGAKKTMMIAQQLYEGIEMGEEGSVGLITYMRTDSTHVAEQALHELADVVRARFGSEYALDKPRRYKTKATRAQEAHEAIRPTEANRDPESVARVLSRDQLRLYTLVWQRSVASQMQQAVFDAVTVDVAAGPHTFRASGQTVRFDGFMRVYTEGRDEPAEDEEAGALPPLEEGQVLRLASLAPVQHFTEPPPRYSEASLVKALEEFGIGRPSTYAQIMSTLNDRKYVTSERKRLVPTELGIVVCDFLADVYPKVVDLEFTAEMEGELDKIAEGDLGWEHIVRVFWTDLEGIKIEKTERPTEATEIPCPECGAETGAKMQKRWGRYGWFLSCERFPDCKARMSLEEGDGEKRPEPQVTEIPCPKCGKPLLRRTGRFGPFLGCSDYPKCKGVRSLDEVEGPEIRCPTCGQGRVVRKRSKKRRAFWGCNRYPDCDYAMWEPPLPVPCPSCSGPLVAAGPGGAKCAGCSAEFARADLPTAGGESPS
ncbi:MAG: type I DNA topoisomerase [Acidobacteria bacterium]|nr:type I DNA topoisomerase [Acidobacteriota bacterium]